MQKEDANQIWITVGGNLINYDEELLVPTADTVTAKLHWNSIMSTALAKYMCIDINFDLMAKLDYLKYMTIPSTIDCRTVQFELACVKWESTS
jgi:hypothetical protein